MTSFFPPFTTPFVEVLALIFPLTALGFFCGRIRLFSATHLEGFELFLFRLALPCSLFLTVFQQDLQEWAHLGYFQAYLGTFCLLAMLSGGFFYARKLSWTPLLLRLLASTYSNAALYSFSVLSLLLQDHRAALFTNLIQVILIQSVAVILLGLLQPQASSIWKSFAKALLSPLVSFPLVGLTLHFCEFRPPSFFLHLIQQVGSSASSLSLFVFGLSLSRVSWKKISWTLEDTWVIASKNFLHPLIAWGLGHVVFHLDSYWLPALVLTASAPAGLSVLLLAKTFSPPTAERLQATTAVSCLVSLGVLLVLAIFLKSWLFR